MLSVEKVNYSVGDKNIINNLSMQAEKGKVNVFLGPNGAGKSTLMRLLAAEVAPTEGHIHFDTINLRTCPLAEMCKCRAVMTQQYDVPLPFTVREVVTMGRYPFFGRKVTTKDLAIVDRLLEEMSLSHLAERHFYQLSGGEKQRVQLTRVIAQLEGEETCVDGKFLLLDEPTSSMDYKYQHSSLSAVRDLTRKGCTVLMVLHDLNLAAQYADDLFFLKNGSLMQSGAVRQTMTSENIQALFQINVDVLQVDNYQYPIIIPKS